jgi:hypothetical protein
MHGGLLLSVEISVKVRVLCIVHCTVYHAVLISCPAVQCMHAFMPWLAWTNHAPMRLGTGD